MTEMRTVRRRTTLPSVVTPTEPVGKSRLIHGDSIEVLRSFEDNSIDAVVCDPPYELNFMNRGWDNSGIAYSVEFWAETLRVLKPGGHLLAFGATRTYHRMACAVEDAGFEIRESLHWVYGEGFPKSLNVSKAIDKAAGVEREVLGRAAGAATSDTSSLGKFNSEYDVTAPTTDEAKQWAGWGTAVKPSHEPVVVARKPLIGTVAANVLEFGTGAMNIDGCRVGTNGGTRDAGPTGGNDKSVTAFGDGLNGRVSKPVEGLGRWPSNLLLDPHAASALDIDSGTSMSRKGKPRTGASGDGWGLSATGAEYSDSGGASRFFPIFKYQAKPSTKERNAGLEGKNTHTTVKPVTLMSWLVRLVTPPGGVVLDPFLGSGTTAIAASLEGFDFVGIEREAEYVDISTKRLIHYGAKFDTIVHQSSENVA